MNGNNHSQNAADQLEAFQKSISDYIELKNIKQVKFAEEFQLANELDLSVIDKLTQQECFNYAHVLYQYLSYVQDEINHHTNICNWCNDRLNYIIANNNDNFPQFTKHVMKIPLIIKENSFASKIDNWRMIAQSRLQILEGKEMIIRKKAECLIEKGKRL